jgi:UDP-N-acetylmuramoyl-L-alanyl-D-glutamate--2,6-diaminopimelate ligase
MKLSALLAGTGALAPATEISGLSLDSRWVTPGDAFVALSGSRGRGLAHLDDAAARGAVVALAEEPPPDDAPLPVVIVPGLRTHLSALASRFYGHPDRDLALVAVTGTDGKTSTTHYIAQALNALGMPCAVIGTLGAGWPGAQVPESHGLTTPDVISLHRTLARLRAQGAQAVALEASSHGLSQDRLEGLEIDVAVLTNLSRDHLDYHGSLEAYAAAKRRLFERPELRAAVVNRDEAFGADCIAELAPTVNAIGYSLHGHPKADLRGHFARSDRHGVELALDHKGRPARLAAALLGSFNGANLLAALGALLGLGIDLDAAVEALSGVSPVPGRMEVFSAPNRPLTVLDYAHTPNALELVLSDFRAYVPGRVWCVLGAMGNRDRGKRPLMAAVAARLSDRIILTDSIPHGEDPAAIIEDLSSGLPPGAPAEVVRSREAAIAHALASAGPDDGVLITGTGKGNERSVPDAEGRSPYSDHAQVNACLGKQAL